MLHHVYQNVKHIFDIILVPSHFAEAKMCALQSPLLQSLAPRSVRNFRHTHTHIAKIYVSLAAKTACRQITHHLCSHSFATVMIIIIFGSAIVRVLYIGCLSLWSICLWYCLDQMERFLFFSMSSSPNQLLLLAEICMLAHMNNKSHDESIYVQTTHLHFSITYFVCYA